MNKRAVRRDAPAAISRDQAIAILKPYLGKDLRPIADEYGVTVWKNGRKNKGWAGMVMEQLYHLSHDFGKTGACVIRDGKGVWSGRKSSPRL